MTDMIGNLRRRAPRFRIQNTEALRVTVTKSDKSFETIHTELVNISVGGAKFKSNQSVTVNEVVSVKIDVEHPGQSISVSGEVRWIAPLDGDEWWLGCAFKPPIPHEILNELARQGVLERREHVRQRISLPVTAQWQLEYEPTTVTVVDYSAGGICLTTDSERGPGERLMLRFQLDDGRDVQVRASTRWEVRCDDGFLIGCEFTDPRDFLLLSDLLEARELLESDLCDQVTPRNVWRRLIKPTRPIRGSVRTAKRHAFQPLKEPASWIMIGGTTFLLLVLALSNQLRTLESQASLGRAQTVLTSKSTDPTKVASDEDETPIHGGNRDISLSPDESAHESLRSSARPEPTWLGPETLITIDRLRVDKEPATLRSEPMPLVEPPSAVETSRNSDTQVGGPAAEPDVDQEVAGREVDGPTTRKSIDRSKFSRSVRNGRAFYRQGDYDRATREFVRAATADPTNPVVRYLLATSQYQLGQRNRANHSIRCAVVLEVDRPIADWDRLKQEWHSPVRAWVEQTAKKLCIQFVSSAAGAASRVN